MKNSKQYAEKLKTFLAKARKGKSFEAEKFLNNTDCAVKAMLYEFITETKAGDCISVMKEHFVDWNDLRVSRVEEVTEVLARVGISAEETKPIYTSISRMLNAIFNSLDRTTLVELDDVGKKQAKQILDDIGEISEFVSAFLMLFLKDAHVVPVAHKACVMLAEMGLVDKGATEGEIINFVSRQVESKDTVNTYYVLRELADAYFEEKEKKEAAEKAQAEKKATARAEKKVTKKTKAVQKPAVQKPAKKKAVKKATKKAPEVTEEEPAAKKPAAKKATAKKTVKKVAAEKKAKPAEKKAVKKASVKKAVKVSVKSEPAAAKKTIAKKASTAKKTTAKKASTRK
ncbi:MAG: hypothetical protein AB7F23_05140 [Phycisphaerae bacterium]